MADPKAALPGGQVVIEDCDPDGRHHGRYRPDPAIDGIWSPVTEEAPDTGGPYARKGGVWVPVVAGGLSVTEIVPAVVTAGTAPTTLNVYGTGFTTATEIRFDGTAVPAVNVTWFAADHMTVAYDPTAATPAVITVTAFEVAAGTGAAGLHIVPASTTTPTVTEIVPDLATVGFSAALQANVYGTGFIDGTSEVLWDGLPLTTAFISANQLGITIDTTMGVAPSSVTVTVAGATGAAGFVFIPESSSVDAGLGLSMDKTTTPNWTINLLPAADNPDPGLGGVYVIDRQRNNTEGLELGIDGRLRAPLATDSLAGTILEPPPDDKGYVRRRDLNGVSAWVPPADSPKLYQGLWQPAANTPDIGTALVKEPGWMWIADCFGRDVPENPPNGVGLVGIEGTPIVEADHIVWDGAIFIRIAQPVQLDAIVHAGIGLEKVADPTGAIINLQPPLVPAGDATKIGGVRVPPRDLTQGLQIEGDGLLTAPKASDTQIGAIEEPKTDGMAYSRQWNNTTDPANPFWEWVPALTAGLQITSIIPDKAIFGPTEPLLDVHAYGSEFTTTCVIHVDGNPAQTSYVSPTELTFVMNPAVPINEQFHIITVHETAPTPVDGLGAEQFDFIVASIAVDYGKGLSFDTSTTPPIVNLDPAGPTNMGGVIVSVRDGTTQGLQIDFGDGTAANPATGELWAPPATADLLGTIKEPPADQKGYVRASQADGSYQWVPPADTVVEIAGTTPDKTGIVWIPPGQSLAITPDGALTAVPTTPDQYGVIRDAPYGTGAADDPSYVRKNGAWEATTDADPINFRVGLFQPINPDGTYQPVVDLKIANLGGEIGGVRTQGRSPIQGLEFDQVTGMITAPLATPVAAGSIVEPPADAKGYVRTTQLDGKSQWVPPAPSETLIAGNVPADLGSVFVPARNKTSQGLDLNADGGLYAPPATHEHLGTIVEPLNDAKTYARKTEAGNSSWVETKSTEIAGNVPADVGVVFVPARNKTSQGLDLNADGGLYAPPATNEHLGTIVEPPNDDKQYARKRSLVGNSAWVEIDNSGGINDVPVQPVGETYVRSNGRWLPSDRNTGAQPRKVNVGGDTMTGLLILSGDPVDEYGAVPRHMLNEMKTYIDAQDTADRLWTETYYADKPPAGGPYWMLNGAWSNIPAGVDATYGIGIDLNGSVVNLQPPKSNPLEIGGVYATPRSERNGIEIDSNGHISAPLATADLAGTIIEPVADGKGYVRASQPDGSYQWVPPASAGAAYDFGIGISVDTTTTPNQTVSLDPAGIGAPAELGGVYIVQQRGLSVNADGGLSLVPATPSQIGGIVDAPWEIGKKYNRENGAWVPATGGVIISDTPPANPVQGMGWWESDSGDLFIWYDDGTSAQWVQVNGVSPPPGVYVADDPPQTPTPNQLWWDSNAGTLNIWYSDPDTSQWVQVAAPQIPGVPEAPIDGVPYSRRDANWVATTSLAATPGDVKDSFAVNDHGGWILLNGRLVNTLSSTQQANAALLGFTTNIPNATGAVTIQNGSAMGTVAGSMTKTIAVANLPAHNMTSGGHDAAAVTSSSSGAHTHTTDSQPNLSMGTGATRGRTATGNTGYYFTDAEGANHKSIAHTHTAASAGAHTHTVDLPNHTHTVALGGSGTPLDCTPKSLSTNKFVYLGT